MRSRISSGVRGGTAQASLSDLLLLLRSALGVAPYRAAPGELAASVGRDLPAVISAVDVGGWLAWVLAGLLVFAARDDDERHRQSPEQDAARPADKGAMRVVAPGRRVATLEAQRVIGALAMIRTHGNISRTALALDTSRRALREVLKAGGLYPLAPGHAA